MTSNKRAVIIGFTFLFLIVVAMSTFHGLDVEIGDEDVNGVDGFFGILFGLGIAGLALFFALSLTGVVLTGVAILLCVVFGVVLGSVALALLPLLFPFLLLAGLVALFVRRKSN